VVGAEPAFAQEATEAAGTAAHAGWWSVLPALVAIGAALAFRQVVVALFLGVWLGAWIAAGDLATGWFTGFFAAIQTYILGALADEGHAAIILFSLLIGGLVGLVQKGGGTQAIVQHVTRWARSAGRGQLATAVLGTAIFFDDYANTLIVGGTMRPITDKLRVSREKLAYIVDSTAAPIACLAFVTTWIGTEVGYISEAIDKIPGYDEAAYSVFLNSIGYSFYPLLALFFVFLVAGTKRDFGPMLAAERRARETGQVSRPGTTAAQFEAEAETLRPKEGIQPRLMNALLPIGVLVAGVLVGLWITGSASAGEGAGLRDVVGAADSYAAMMWASLASVVTAVVLLVAQRIVTLEESIEAMMAGMRTMLFALLILVLAWALSEVNGAIGTGEFLKELLSDRLNPGFVPALVFLLAAATAFATGSSWGTMGILMPLVVPLAWNVLAADGLHTSDEYYHIIYSAVSAVLAGAVWGDHCSPISDTTILSSLASQCDHIDHVRTQLPYALTVGGAALLLGTLPAGFGMPWWAGLLLGIGVLTGLLFWIGRPVEDANVEVAAP
jgi:Na+/H+ antiporter NhaC